MGDGLDDNYFNAGTMLLAPSQPLFDLLAADVQAADPAWHIGGWSPEQKYLSRVYAGEWSHISQLFNFEVQLHSGVPVTPLWEEAEVTDIAVCHFSGSPKVWSYHPADEKDSLLTNYWVQDAFNSMPTSVKERSVLRYRALSAEWHRTLAAALQFCRGRVPLRDTGSWGSVLESGVLPSLGSPPSEHVPLPINVGQELTFKDEGGITRRGEIVRVDSGSSQALFIGTVWSVPLPGENSLGAGPFGLCQQIKATADCTELKSFPLGEKAAAWTGEGHLLGVVQAASGHDRFVQFTTNAPPRWIAISDLRPLAEVGTELQCADCLGWVVNGEFEHGVWICSQCSS